MSTQVASGVTEPFLPQASDCLSPPLPPEVWTVPPCPAQFQVPSSGSGDTFALALSLTCCENLGKVTFTSGPLFLLCNMDRTPMMTPNSQSCCEAELGRNSGGKRSGDEGSWSFAASGPEGPALGTCSRAGRLSHCYFKNIFNWFQRGWEREKRDRNIDDRKTIDAQP